MTFTVDALIKLRPFLYHLTAGENIERIRARGELQSTARIAAAADRLDIVTIKRRGHVAVSVNGEDILLRDQAPLHAGNMRLDDGWSFADFLGHLNRRVFFWPGGEDGPISYGLRHFQRYENELPRILRVPFDALVHANPDTRPELCRYNSGSPRWSRGVAAPRGVQTFVTPDEARFSAAQVVEVTFCDVVQLPRATCVGSSPGGPWEPLFN